MDVKPIERSVAKVRGVNGSKLSTAVKTHRILTERKELGCTNVKSTSDNAVRLSARATTRSRIIAFALYAEALCRLHQMWAKAKSSLSARCHPQVSWQQQEHE